MFQVFIIFEEEFKIRIYSLWNNIIIFSLNKTLATMLNKVLI